MITFREHLKINKFIESDKNISGYLDSLDVADKIKAIRDISDFYPIKEDTNVSTQTETRFNCYKDIDELVLGQFIMIEQIITGKTNYISSAHNDLELAKLVIRPKHHSVFDNDDVNEESKNQNNILDTDVRQVYAVLQRFLNNRDYVLFTQFKGVFYEVPDDDEDEEEEVQEKTGESLFQQQWYWYSIVRMLAKEDITRYEEIYMLRMNLVMPEMSYIAQKNKIDSANVRQEQMTRKL
tara:strand:- start:817 stop:1530 length:714 start_codon:yes stop_codon:yes gene_type:complete